MKPKPMPVVRGEDKEWFAAAADGRFVLGLCRACGARFLPRSVCPHCWSQDVEVADASGRGAIYSFTTLYRAGVAGHEADVPYVVGLIETEEGVRVLAKVVGIPVDEVTIGMNVDVVFESYGEGLTVPYFTPRTA